MKGLLNFLFVISCFTSMGQARIDFISGSWESILAKAQKENKLIFVDIYTTWCKPCIRLDQTTYVDKDVAEFFNSNFINVKFDAEKEEGMYLRELFDVTAYPNLLFVDFNGSPVERHCGYVEAEELLEIGNNALKSPAYKEIVETYLNKPRTPESRYEYVQLLVDVCQKSTDAINEMKNSLQSYKKEREFGDYVSTLVLLIYLTDQADDTKLRDALVSALKESQQQSESKKALVSLLEEVGSDNPYSDAFEDGLTVYYEELGDWEALYGVWEYKYYFRKKQYPTFLVMSMIMLNFLAEEKNASADELIVLKLKTRMESDSKLLASFESLLEFGRKLKTGSNQENVIKGQLEYLRLTKNFKELSILLAGVRNEDLSHTALNNIAWHVAVHIDDKEALVEATTLVKKSIEMESHSYNNDTYAALLYNLGRKQEAVASQRKAIELAKAEEIDTGDYEDRLKLYLSGK